MKESMLWNKLKDTFAESSYQSPNAEFHLTWLGSRDAHSAISTESVINLVLPVMPCHPNIASNN